MGPWEDLMTIRVDGYNGPKDSMMWGCNPAFEAKMYLLPKICTQHEGYVVLTEVQHIGCMGDRSHYKRSWLLFQDEEITTDKLYKHAMEAIERVRRETNRMTYALEEPDRIIEEATSDVP